VLERACLVDDVGPILTVLVAVAHQAREDRVAVDLVTDQDAAEVVTGPGVELEEKSAKVAFRFRESA
jgi:hypothetical protein